MLLLLPLAAAAQWESELGKMPLAGGTAELGRMDAIPRMLKSFQKNPAVKGLVFMPGATDEFYFFKRAKIKVAGSSPTLMDALVALTNQNPVLLKYEAPFVVVYTAEDPNPMLLEVKDEKTAAKLKNTGFAKEVKYSDKDWDTAYKSIRYNFNTRLEPAPKSHESNHFFRYHITAYELTNWEMMHALCLAGKTKVSVERNKVVFLSDPRIKGRPTLEGIRTFN